MPRKPHYWRLAGGTCAPDTFLFFDSETIPDEHHNSQRGELHNLRLGVAIYYRLEGGKRTRCDEISYRSGAEFWAFVQSKLSRDRPLWLMAHNISFDLGTVSGWRRLSAADCEWASAIFEQGIFFLRGTMEGKPLVLCDTANYYKCSLYTIGKSVGMPKMEMPKWGDSDLKWLDYCYNDVMVTALGMDRLLEFWREHELGPWGPTIASLAFNAYRRRFMRYKVLVHTEEKALDLERKAYYGGRVDTNFIGKVPCDRVTELDFSSLYPSTYVEPMPSRLVTVVDNPSLMQLRSTPKGYMMLADVTLKTAKRTYPYREDGRVIHPVGTYQTCLPHPELTIALESNHVVACRRCCWYVAEPIYAPFLEYFYPLKQRYEREGNTAFRTIAKYLMNALYGKSGQQSPLWLPWGEEALRLIEKVNNLPEGALQHHLNKDITNGENVEPLHIPELPKPLQIRRYWGYPEVSTKRVESRDSCPAIAATVTSYARVKLSDVQETAGKRNWYYSDTDSIWCNPEGVDRLRGCDYVHHDVPGKLELKRTVSHMYIHGRKDYEAEGDIILKGIRKDAKVVCPGVYEQLHFPSALSQLQDRIDSAVFVRTVLKHLRRNVDWCTVNADGFTSPLVRPKKE